MTEERRYSDDAIIEKIRKAYAIANDPNATPGQVEAALALAMRLQTKYNVEVNMVERPKLADYVNEIGVETGERIPVEWPFICPILNKYYNITTIRDVRRGRDENGIFFIGTKENVEIAKFIYNQLYYQYKSLWAGARDTYGYKTKQKRAYYLGLMAGFIRKLEDEKKAIENEMHLVIVKDSQIDEAVAGFFPKISNKKMAKFDRNDEVTEAGKRDAHKLQILAGLKSSNRDLVAIIAGRKFIRNFAKMAGKIYTRKKYNLFPGGSKPAGNLLLMC